MGKKHYLYFIIIIFVSLFFIFLNTQLKPPEKSVTLENGWILETGNKLKNIGSLPYYTAGDRDDDFIKSIYVFSCNFHIKNDISDPLIFLPFIAGNGIRLYIDDTYIGQAGDLKNGNASIWNKEHVYLIPEMLKAGSHELKIQIYGLYEAGILSVPYILSRSEGIFRKQFLHLYFQNLIDIIAGILLLLSLIFILTEIASHEKSGANIYMAFFLLSILLYIFDYSVIDYLYMDYLIFKKTTFTGIYLAMIFLINLTNKLFNLENNKIDYLFIAISTTILITGIVIPENMIEFRQIYTRANIFVIPVLFYIAYKILKTKKRTLQAELLLTGIIIVFFISGYDIIQLFTAKGTIFYTHIGLIIFTFITSAITAMNIIEIYTLAALEKGRADKFHRDSLTDSLTGTYNRRIMGFLDELLTDIYSLILIDMDKFKDINDTYGHHTGDMVLKKTADIIHEATRDSDYLIRFGGDEFLLVLPGCKYKEGKILEKRIIGKSDYSITSENGKEITFSFSTGFYAASDEEKIDDGLKKADLELYKVKNNKRK